MQLYWQDKSLSTNKAFRQFVMKYHREKERESGRNCEGVFESSEVTRMVKEYIARQGYHYTRFFCSKKCKTVVAVIIKKTFGR